MSFCGCKEGFLFESRSGSCYREFSPASCPPGTTWRRRLSGVSTFPSSIAPVLTCSCLLGTTWGMSGHYMEKATLRGKHLAQFHGTCSHPLLACWAQHGGGGSPWEAPCPVLWHLFSPASCPLGTTWRRWLSGVSTLPSSIAPVLTHFLSAGHNMEEAALWGKLLSQFHCTCSHPLLARWAQHGGGDSPG
jgi:hypothetical protein